MTDKTLAQLIEAHQAELFRYLKYLGADQTAAEDLVQDAFLRAFRAASPPDLDQVNLRRAWLRRICHNLFIDHCRRHTGSPSAQPECRDTGLDGPLQAQRHRRNHPLRHLFLDDTRLPHPIHRLLERA